MRISDWSSDGGSSDLAGAIAGWTIDDFRKHWTEKRGAVGRVHANIAARVVDPATGAALHAGEEGLLELKGEQLGNGLRWLRTTDRAVLDADHFLFIRGRARSEEHTSELQSLIRISYAVFCLKQKKQ